jgi:hypothetical protein
LAETKSTPLVESELLYGFNVQGGGGGFALIPFWLSMRVFFL